MKKTEVYLVEIRNGMGWELEAELYTAQDAWRHRKETIAAFEVSSVDTRVIAFVGGFDGDVTGAAAAWTELRDSCKPCGRKAMARIGQEHRVTVNFLSGREKVELFVGNLPV